MTEEEGRMGRGSGLLVEEGLERGGIEALGGIVVWRSRDGGSVDVGGLDRGEDTSRVLWVSF